MAAWTDGPGRWSTSSPAATLLAEQGRGGAVVVIATHDPEVAGSCDRQVHLVDGRIARELTGTASTGSRS